MISKGLEKTEMKTEVHKKTCTRTLISDASPWASHRTLPLIAYFICFLWAVGQLNKPGSTHLIPSKLNVVQESGHLFQSARQEEQVANAQRPKFSVGLQKGQSYREGLQGV